MHFVPFLNLREMGRFGEISIHGTFYPRFFLLDVPLGPRFAKGNFLARGVYDVIGHWDGGERGADAR